MTAPSRMNIAAVRCRSASSPAPAFGWKIWIGEPSDSVATGVILFEPASDTIRKAEPRRLSAGAESRRWQRAEIDMVLGTRDARNGRDGRTEATQAVDGLAETKALDARRIEL